LRTNRNQLNMVKAEAVQMALTAVPLTPLFSRF